eukprot:7822314-Alexandrium_andersonii.AAC.1
MPPAPNSIEPLMPPPMAGGSGADGPDAPWPGERGKAEVIGNAYVPPRKGTKRPSEGSAHAM